MQDFRVADCGGMGKDPEEGLSQFVLARVEIYFFFLLRQDRREDIWANRSQVEGDCHNFSVYLWRVKPLEQFWAPGCLCHWPLVLLEFPFSRDWKICVSWVYKVSPKMYGSTLALEDIALTAMGSGWPLAGLCTNHMTNKNLNRP